MKKHNFFAGPAELDETVIKNTADNIIDFAGTGISIMAISHRSKEFIAVMEKAVNLTKELLDVPSTHEVIFLQGGASLQFAMLPMNLLDKKAAYVDSGTWASNAIKEAKLFGEVVVVGSSKDKNYNYIPVGWEKNIPSDASYLHYTSNNTIFGTQFKKDPDVNVLLASDMSSDIFWRPVDVSKYAIIYAGAQKNIGPSGITLAIVRKDLLDKINRPVPTMLKYSTHVDKESMYNTPPTVATYACVQSLERFKNLGGVKALGKIADQRANSIYDEIDRNKLFVSTVPDASHRSNMNITFVMNEQYKDLEKDFTDFAKSRNIVGITGHRSVGGFRASVYLSQRDDSVNALIQAMKDFEKK
ncbi:MAG: 3-phosphoserine/phosphohydroxythreonine transaminase [Bacteroidales bacterium]|nr:3-phosphoserine/phosphohydroxythreonine transaminase [Bacteroidales bacterium]